MRVGDIFECTKVGTEIFTEFAELTTGIPFISCTVKNNGLSAYVKPKTARAQKAKIFPAGCITVQAVFVAKAFLQDEPFYAHPTIWVLKPLKPLSRIEKLFYCQCISANDFRFSYGRTITDPQNIPLPTEIPSWVYEQQDFLTASKDQLLNRCYEFRNLFSNTKCFSALTTENTIALAEIFDITGGQSMDLNATRPSQTESEGVPYVSCTAENNGISKMVQRDDRYQLYPAGILTTAAGLNLQTHVQSTPCYVHRNVWVLQPKTEMSLFERLYFAFCIRQNGFRYSYGRAAVAKDFHELQIPAQVPSWVYRQSDFLQLQQEAIMQQAKKFVSETLA